MSTDSTDSTATSTAEATTPQPDSSLPMILVGVDGSDDGLRATRYAARAAGQRARLHLLHAADDAVLAGAWGVVYDPTTLQETGDRALEVARQAAIEAGLDAERITSEVALGNPAAILSRMSEQAALLVMGRRSVSGLERMFVGSTSVAAVAGTHCPAVIISQAANPDPTGSNGLVVVGVDGGPHAGTTLRWAFDEASARGAKLEIVHVSEPKATGLFGRGRTSEEAREAQVATAREGLTGLVDKIKVDFPTVEHQIEVLYGNPVDALAARTGHADLLILGIKAPGPGHAVGGVVRGLMAHAQAPLCLIP